ncbi:MAG: response regulator [Firmicutes bacterium]|nr:response regulator [Bacillota bacterium]
MERSRKTFIITIILVFCILGGVVFSVARRISAEMSSSAIGNLSESLELLKSTVETLLKKEAEFQKLIAEEIATTENPEEFIRNYQNNNTMVKMSVILAGKEEGISNTGDVFSADDLDFSAGLTAEGLPVSTSYINSMGTWAYTIKCPILKDSRKIAELYVEYIYDSFDEALPDSFYNNSAILYIMDTESQRFVLRPKGMEDRVAGRLNLKDFYHANNISEQKLQEGIAVSLTKGENIMFYHEIMKKESLIYMWALNEGSLYLVGYVPTEAVQQEGRAVNQNIFIVVAVMLIAFLICCTVYFLTERQQNRLRKEREAEREIYNKQLSEALQAAQIANTSKTTFLSNMSHDIRTPMNAILGFATLLEKDVDNPGKVSEYTKKITTSGRHLLSLINDVLDVSKIESGKTVLTLDKFALDKMISSIDAIIRPAAKEKRQSFDISVTGIKHEELIGDETRINQILINLLSNAVKYTPEGGNIWLRIIGLKQRSRQYEHIRIEVEDNGYGMTPEYLEVIFDAFTRAENSTTNKVQGTGLGMAITKSIVELMGGTIEVSSQVDQGSLFTVELELRIQDKEEDEHFWTRNNILRILAVDEEDNCKNICSSMEGCGVQIDTAFDSAEAFERIDRAHEQGNPYNVILLDWNTVGASLNEMVKQTRAAGQEQDPASDSAHVPILLLTAYDWGEVQDEAGLEGVDGLLQKPFFVSALKEKLLSVYAERNGEHQLTGSTEIAELEGRNFLVVEDNEINAEILIELFDIEGATCELEVNGKLAVERFEKALPREFDAIFMDVQMSVMNGYEATKAIRALDREDARTIPIIAMTANAFAEDVKEAINAGMSAHVAKPVDMDILKKTVKPYFREKGMKNEKEH